METIGKYEILRRIGEGGFGVVYHGRDPFLRRPVAIKTLSTDLPDLRDRFFREAEVAGRLQHAAITNVYDFGFDGPTPYLVQEYLEGEDLDELIARREPVPLLAKVELLIQVAEGLAYAHGEGVVHRDIKPANLRLVGRRRLKIMDFGIAKLKGAASQLTRTGMTLGTAAYLPPEQLRGEAVDHRADIFSLGASAYELLAYRRPFDATSVHHLFFQILREDPPDLATLCPDCPPRLAAAIGRCLRKDPQERFQSCEELRAELLAVREEVYARDGGASLLDIPMPRATPARRPTAAELPTGQRVELLRSRAQSAIARDELAEAREALLAALALVPGDVDVVSALAAVEGELERRTAERSQRLRITEAAGEIAAALDRGDLVTAAELLAEAQLALGDDVAVLAELRVRLDTARRQQRAAEVAALLAAAEGAIAAGELRAGAVATEHLARLEPDHLALARLRTELARLAAARQRQGGEQTSPEDTVGGLSALPAAASAPLAGFELWMTGVGERLRALPQPVILGGALGLALLLAALLLWLAL